MIPKILHYVWVGGNKKPKNIRRCMKSWKKHLKGWKIIEWNEENFDMNSHPFIRDAYEKKQWAFISDYIRAYVIYNYGGVYFDTDVVMVDNINDLLYNKAFVGYESPDYPFTAVFGAEKGHPLIKDMLDYYDNLKIEYKHSDNNTISVSNILINKYNCKLGNKSQILKEDIKVYPNTVLCVPSVESKTIHVFTTTWNKEKLKLKNKIAIYLLCHCNKKWKVKMYLDLLELNRKIKKFFNKNKIRRGIR